MDEYWTARDGRQIAVGDMTEQHAKNCLRMILRRNREGLSGPDALDFYHEMWLNDEDSGQRADLRGADLQGADLRRADLRGAYLQEADLQGADLRGADLRIANLQGANLQGANLWRADLQGADLWGANLQGANLWRANLQGADLQGADLWGADIDFSCWPLWCGSKGVIVDLKIVYQLLAHVACLQCDDPEFVEIKKAIMPWAVKSHIAKNLGLTTTTEEEV